MGRRERSTQLGGRCWVGIGSDLVFEMGDMGKGEDSTMVGWSEVADGMRWSAVLL